MSKAERLKEELGWLKLFFGGLLMEWIVVAALAVLLGGLGLVLREVAVHDSK